MLSGRPLFADETVGDTLSAVLKAERIPTAPSRAHSGRDTSAPPSVPERNPKNRIHDVADVRIVLDDVIAGRTDEGTSPTDSVAIRRSPWRTAVWGSARPGRCRAGGLLLARRPEKKLVEPLRFSIMLAAVRNFSTARTGFSRLRLTAEASCSPGR